MCISIIFRRHPSLQEGNSSKYPVLSSDIVSKEQRMQTLTSMFVCHLIFHWNGNPLLVRLSVLWTGSSTHAGFPSPEISIRFLAFFFPYRYSLKGFFVRVRSFMPRHTSQKSMRSKKWFAVVRSQKSSNLRGCFWCVLIGSYRGLMPCSLI